MKLRFRPGYIGGWTQEEREFFLSLFKDIKIENFTDLEKRMIKRLVLRLMGEKLIMPLRVPVECDICNYEYRYIERHRALCELKQKRENRRAKIDPVVWDMLR